MSTPFTFTLPEELSAKEPPERRGIARDEVRLMVIHRASHQVEHTQFNHLGCEFRKRWPLNLRKRWPLPLL